MKVIVKLYEETGSREDWQTKEDYILEVPDGTDLSELDRQLMNQLTAKFKAEGLTRSRDLYLWVDELKEPLTNIELIEMVTEFAKEREQRYHG